MFSVLKLQINRGTTTANTQGGNSVTVTHTYKDTSITTATIRTIFPDYLNQGANEDVIFVGDHMLVEGSETTIYCKILSLAPFTLGPDLFSEASGLNIGPTIPAIDNNAIVFSNETLQMEQADKTHSGILTATTQDIGGLKTFWANTQIITNNSFIVPNEGNGYQSLQIKTQTPLGGIQILNDNINHDMAYAFGTSTLGTPYAGMIFIQNGFFGGTPLLYFSINATVGLAINNSGNVLVPTVIQTDTINEFTPSHGTAINGANLIGGGIQFTPAQTLLNHYEEFTFTDTYTLGTQTTASVTISFVRIGKTVTMSVLAVGQTAAQGSPGTNFQSNTTIPVQFQPSVPMVAYWEVFNNFVAQTGQLKILGGSILFYADQDEATDFHSGVTNAFGIGSFTYNIS